FVLYGYSKGGLVAEWIALRVKAANGRIERVITVDSLLDGANPADVVEIVNHLRGSETVQQSLPGIQELPPDSNTIRALTRDPVNDMRAAEVIRVWGKDDKTVTQDSALRRPPGDVNKAYRVVTISTEKGGIVKNGDLFFKPTDHRAMRSFLAKHSGLLKHILL